MCGFYNSDRFSKLKLINCCSKDYKAELECSLYLMLKLTINSIDNFTHHLSLKDIGWLSKRITQKWNNAVSCQDIN